MIIVIFLLAAFFAMNMGGSGFAASFAAAYGGNVVSRLKAALFFVLFVVLGALVLGQNVATTLGENIMPVELLSAKALIVIFITASLSMFVANLMKIPQTTSIVTVAAIAGVALHFGSINGKTIAFLIPFWIVLPIICFGLTYFLASKVYPPRKSNFWFYEKYGNNTKWLKIFVIVASCYNAFSVGTNNVANVVGPLVSSQAVPNSIGMISMAIIFGLGAFVFSGPIKTAGKQIIPLGPLTASIIALVTGTLMILASYWGIPQSFVMLKMAALFAISGLKRGKRVTFKDPTTLKTLYTWSINPILTLMLSFVLAKVIL